MLFGRSYNPRMNPELVVYDYDQGRRPRYEAGVQLNGWPQRRLAKKDSPQRHRGTEKPISPVKRGDAEGELWGRASKVAACF